MTRADIAGCPGQFIRIRGRTAALCFGCSRYSLATAEQIEPAAHLNGPGGEWVCPDRLGVHELNVRLSAQDSYPLEAGFKDSESPVGVAGKSEAHDRSNGA